MRNPSKEAIREALENPGGYVYEIDNSYGPFTDESHIPPSAIIGAWKVNDSGIISGGFIPNENYIGPKKLKLSNNATIKSDGIERYL